MKSSANKKRLAFILATLLLITATSIGYLFTTTAEETVWSLQEATDIYVESTISAAEDNDAIISQASLFSSELSGKLNESEARVVSSGAIDFAGDKDIVLRLSGSNDISDQGYSVYKESERLIIEAKDKDGLFYGCRYVIKQILLNNGGVNPVTNDHPDVDERAFFLDIGRKYFTPDWLKSMIREISWSNMNTIIFHFSEEMGLGLESTLYPWLNGRSGALCTVKDVADDNRYITQEEMADIIEYAKSYHVEVIPSFDSPGHMNHIVKRFNEKSATGAFSFEYEDQTINVPQNTDIGNYFHYNGQKELVKGSRNQDYSRGIDISNDIARSFTMSLIKEYADFFNECGCTKIDLGGDELLGWGSAVSGTLPKWQQLDHWKQDAYQRALAERVASINSIVAYDEFVYYMNDLYDLAYASGYETMRMWNDDAYRTHDTAWTGAIALNQNYQIEFWSYKATVSNLKYSQFSQHGYDVVNYLSDYNYYVLGAGKMNSYPNATAAGIYNNWNPYVFSSDGSDDAVLHDERVKATAYLVWCDDPSYMSEDEVKTAILPMIRANGAKAWNATINESLEYADFSNSMNLIGNYPTTLPPIYVAPDTTILRLAVEAFAHENPDDYTPESFAAYAAAIEQCQHVLDMHRPTAQDVENAVAAMREAYNALVPATGKVKKKTLDDLIAVFPSVDKDSFTEESYRAYKNAINSAKNMLNKGEYTQVDVNNRVAAIRCAYNNLTQASDNNNLIANVKLRTGDVNIGSVAILGVVISDESQVDHYGIKCRPTVVYGEGEQEPETPDLAERDIIKQIRNDTKGVTYLYFTPEIIGLNVDTVYAYDASGNVIGRYTFIINVV